MSSAEGSYRPALAGALLALAAVLGLVEAALLPPLPVPGVKLGLANIAVLVALVSLGRGWALLVSLGRVAVVGAITGSLLGPAGMLAAAGALAAWAAMVGAASWFPKFSVVGWSVAGAAAHVTAQFVVAWLLLGLFLPPALLGFAIASSALTGMATGIVAAAVLSRLRVPLAVRRSRVTGVGVRGAAAGR